MRRKQHIFVLGGLLLALLTVSYGQESLGDVARKQQEKQKARETQTAQDTQPAHKVITDEDMPEYPPSANDDSASNSGTEEGESAFQRAVPSGQSAENWKASILAQKNLINSLQAQCDKLSASIHYVQANLYTNGVEYNRYQQQKQQQLQQMQKRLEQKKKLDMQETARKAGFGSAVYDL